MSRAAKRLPAVWLIGAGTAFSLLGDQALYSTLPVYFDDLGLRAIEVGILLSANRWIRLFTNQVAHRLLERADQRLLFAAAAVLGAITTAVYAITPGFALFLLARMAWGLSWSFIRHLGTLTVLEASADGSAGRSAGLLGGISRTGSIGGLLGGAMLVDWLGFGPALGILALISLIAVPLVWVGFVPVTGVSRSAAVAEGGSIDVSRVLGFTHGMVGAGLVIGTLGAVLDERLTANGWWSAATLTGAVLAVRFLLESVAAPLLGAVSDHHGVRSAATGFFGLGAVSLLVAILSPSLALLVVGIVAFFVSGTALGAGLVGSAAQRGSRSLASYVTAADLGAAAGPLLGWIALDVFDERRIGLALGAVLYGVSAMIALRYLNDEDSVAEAIDSTMSAAHHDERAEPNDAG